MPSRASQTQKAIPMPTRFNPDTGYYESSAGKPIKRDEIIGWIDTMIGETADILRGLSDSYMAGDLSLSQWRDQMAGEIQDSFIALYLLGRGGQGQMTAGDWTLLAALIDQQRQYLDRFRSQVESGESSGLQMSERGALYAGSSRQAYEAALSAVAKGLGMDEESWYTRPVKTEHCNTCKVYEDMGWQPVGTFPMPGAGGTECLSNCNCYKLYRNVASGVIYAGLD